MAGQEDGFVLLNLDLWILILGSYAMKRMGFWFGIEGISQNWEIIINLGVYQITIIYPWNLSMWVIVYSSWTFCAIIMM